jgi:V-type H+-transporting ATPase subunit a
MLLMMGCFAVYAGLVYNDLFSLPLSLFRSQYTWKLSSRGSVLEDSSAKMTSSYGDASNVYPFGVDPAWHISSNELLFFNSMKMKISVILGILQMNVGILLKGMNAVYFKQPLDLYLEVVVGGCGCFAVAAIVTRGVSWSSWRWGLSWWR